MPAQLPERVTADPSAQQMHTLGQNEHGQHGVGAQSLDNASFWKATARTLRDPVGPHHTRATADRLPSPARVNFQNDLMGRQESQDRSPGTAGERTAAENIQPQTPLGGSLSVTATGAETSSNTPTPRPHLHHQRRC